MTERRNEQRIISLYKNGYVRSETGLHFVTMRNISDSGICCDAYPGVTIGNEVEFCFDDAAPRTGIVKWVENGRIGVSAELGRAIGEGMYQQLSPRSVRLPISLTASLFAAGHRSQVTIQNLSVRGACIANATGLRTGQLVSIEAGKRSFEMACVRWISPQQAGICFARPVPRAEFRRLVEQLQRCASEPRLDAA